MSAARRLGLAAVMALCLGACGQRETVETGEESAEARIAAALDPCAPGSNAYRQSLCENEALAALDESVRETLVAEAASVSPAGGQMLVQNEQRWREAARISCGILDPAVAPSAEQAACLETNLRARVAEAQSAVEERGGYTFQRVELVDATPVTAAIAAASGLGEGAPHAVTRDIRFPRIDGAASPQIQRFNELVAQQPQYRLEDATEEVVDYEIAYAGEDIISVKFTSSEYSLGAAHPNNGLKAVTVVMTTGQPLTEADVFRAGSRWQDFITRRAVEAITAQFRDYEFVPPERDVRESATKPHLWLITENGLVILFPPYSFGGSHAMGGAEVTIPWTDLAPYLNPNAPRPIRAEA